MEKLFSTKVLCVDEDGESILKSFKGRVQPGSPFLSDTGEKIFLGGGFPSLSPDTAFPLSPGLQLATDLSSFSVDELLNLAEAELRRIGSIKFHSYGVDANVQVSVIATDVKLLEKFVETYGGVLEIEPLLLNRHHSDFNSATEIDIIADAPGYTISFTERSPVNRELCTYCGECGPACPEKCISPEVQVNFDKCTFCKECESVCSTNALDMYGVEEKSMRIPAIIVLGDVSVELPADISAIYREEQLPQYFATLYSSNVEEVVCHNNSTCQYSGRLRVGCSRCVDSCPCGAITQDHMGVRVDHLLCEECGDCIAACPTGSMQYARFTDQAWKDFIQQAGVVEKKTVIIGSEKELHSLWWQNKGKSYDDVFFLEYPNISALTSFHLLHLFAVGVPRIALLSDGMLSSDAPISQQVEMTNYVVSELYGSSCVQFVGIAEFEAYIQQGKERPVTTFFSQFNGRNRRANLSELLAFLVSSSGRTIASHPSLKALASVSCDEKKCTHCMACLGECSMQALQADETSLLLTYEAGKCVGCSVCVRVCPENALTLRSDFVIDDDFFAKETLAQADPAICKACGKVYGTRKSLDRVMQILSSKEQVDMEHFEYCENCKVVKLFEAER